MTSDGARATDQLPKTFVRAFLADPRHGAEMAVLYALPHVVSEVERRRQKRVARRDAARDAARDGTGSSVEHACRRLVSRTVFLSRRDGALTGTSFYVGMPAAMASTYLHQLVMVLEIAALHGREPNDPARAAEILVIQGRYPTAVAAGEVLASLGTLRSERSRRGPWSTTIDVLRQVPSVIGVKVRSARSSGALSAAIAVLKVVSYLVPVLSIPVCAASSARTTRHLGRSAQKYYAEIGASADSSVDAPADFPRPPGRSRRADRLANMSLAVAGFVVAGVSVLWVTVDHHAVRIGLLVVELAVAVTFVRLWRITRPARATA
jgi:hypothetical protein